jgi:hypothetical protein
MTQPFPVPATARHAAGPPKAPGATASLVLGIVSVAGVLVLLPVFLAPLAWYHGAAAARRVEREPDRWSGRSEAHAGRVLGIVGTVLMAVVLGGLLLAALGVTIASSYDAGYGT